MTDFRICMQTYVYLRKSFEIYFQQQKIRTYSQVLDAIWWSFHLLLWCISLVLHLGEGSSSIVICSSSHILIDLLKKPIKHINNLDSNPFIPFL